MNTKTMSQFEMMDTEMLAKVEGGFGGWGERLGRYGCWFIGWASTFSNFGSIKW